MPCMDHMQITSGVKAAVRDATADATRGGIENQGRREGVRRSHHVAMAPLTVPGASWVLSTASGRVRLDQPPEGHKVKRPEVATQWDPRGRPAAASATEVLGQQAQWV